MLYVKLAHTHQQTSTMLERPLRTTCGISTATHSSISADDGSNFTSVYKRQRPTYSLIHNIVHTKFYTAMPPYSL